MHRVDPEQWPQLSSSVVLCSQGLHNNRVMSEDWKAKTQQQWTCYYNNYNPVIMLLTQILIFIIDYQSICTQYEEA